MPVATKLEVLDLRHFSSRQLRPLLEDEARVWKLRLRWNYQSSTELLLQYLDSRLLPGFVTLDRGRICGFAFCVYEGQKAVIGDVYAYHDSEIPAVSTAQLLLQHLLDLLQNSPEIERIESQLLLYSSGLIDDVFLQSGFTLFPRHFMEWNLSRMDTTDYRSEIPAGLDLSNWTNNDYHAAAELIYLAYTDHIDAQVNDQYRSLHGSLRFLHNIVRFPGCGIFHPESSLVLREKETGRLAGVVLCSDVGEQTGHITQLCIAAQYRGYGLGRLLMQRCAERLSVSGFQAITLTVTAANHPAMQLYRALGFEVRHSFNAMVYDRVSTPRGSSALHA